MDEARTLMAVTTKDLRTATRLQARAPRRSSAADGRDVTFYANLNNVTGGPRKVRIYVDASNTLISQSWAPDAGSVAPDYTYNGTPALRYVGRYLANSTPSRSSSTSTTAATSCRPRRSGPPTCSRCTRSG